MLSGMQSLKLFLAPVCWCFLESTMRIDPFPTEIPTSCEPAIFVSLHRDLLPAIMYLKPTKLAIVISSSPDGDILVHTLGSANYNFVRGASGQDGGRAFVGMKKMLESGVSVGVAVDGPLGPYGKIHDGALHLARMTGHPIIPIKAVPSCAVKLKTWDRTVLPLPFSRVRIESGKPLRVDSTATNFQDQKRSLEEFFQVGEGSHESS
jgi:lysophospholipid acyltransferase (LPLAT)-like uncharacterized protein